MVNSKNSVLIVDDDPDIISLLTQCIEADHFLSTDSVEQALRYVKEKVVDVIISDVNMPEGNGMDLLRRVKSIDPEIPVIIMTGSTDKALILSALRLGAFDYVDKMQLVDLVTLATTKAIQYRQLTLEKNRLREEAEQKNRKLQELNFRLVSFQDEQIKNAKLATIGTMIANISHDLNNPLHLICGFGHRMIKDLHSSPQPDLKLVEEYAEIIIDSASRMTEIIKRYKRFVPHPESQFQSIDLAETMSDAIAIVFETYQSDDIAIFWDPPKVSVPISGDKILLQQVFINLFENARSAILHNPEKAGSIKVSLKMIENFAILVVKDDGCGIKKEDKEKVFQAFYSTKKDNESSGFGLPICKRIMGFHRGSIALHILPDETKFELKIPISAQQSAVG